MARLIDADALIRSVCHKCNDVNYDDPCEPGDCALYYAVHNAPTVDAVPVVHFNALKSLINGEWVDCKLVEETLDIDFATGLKMLNFSRTAEWNPAPMNGQKITTKFRLKNAVDLGVE